MLWVGLRRLHLPVAGLQGLPENLSASLQKLPTKVFDRIVIKTLGFNPPRGDANSTCFPWTVTKGSISFKSQMGAAVSHVFALSLIHI